MVHLIIPSCLDNALTNNLILSDAHRKHNSAHNPVFIYASIVWLFCTSWDEQLYTWNCNLTEILVRQCGWLSMPLQQLSFVWDVSRYIESCLGFPFIDLLSCYIFLFEKEGLKWTTSTQTDFSRGDHIIQQKFPGPKFPWQYIAFLLLLQPHTVKTRLLF